MMKTRKGGGAAAAAVVLVLVALLVGYEAGFLPVPSSSTSGSSTSTTTTTVSSASSPTFSPLGGVRLGFWVADDDIWSGSPLFGIQGPLSPAQFFSNYFMTPPYPATMLWTSGLTPSGPFDVSYQQESSWLNQVASLADARPNIKILMLFFVNVSGNSIVTGVDSSTSGITITRSAPDTKFTVTGLAASTTYGLELEDHFSNPVASLLNFTTAATGSYTGSFPLSGSLEDTYPYLITVPGTSLSAQVNTQNDQTQELTQYLQTIRGHSSIVGAQFEPEYFGNTPVEQATFRNVIYGAGYQDLVGDSYSGTSDPILYFSAFPYHGGAIPAVFGGNAVGENYGEVGTPDCSIDPCPAWSQANVLTAVNRTPAISCVILDAEQDTGNPAGSNFLWSLPLFRSWIANDPYYAANYLEANQG